LVHLVVKIDDLDYITRWLGIKTLVLKSVSILVVLNG